MRRSNLNHVTLIGALALASAVFVAPAVLAQNSVAVTSSAAMGNSIANQPCSGDGMPGPCGLELRYEPGQTNIAFVQDGSPNKEKIYRARMWVDLNNFDAPQPTRNFFFLTHGDDYAPLPGAVLPTVRATIIRGNGLCAIGSEAWDNQLNQNGVPGCLVPCDGPFEVQIEWSSGNVPTPGLLRHTTFENGVQTCQNEVALQNGAINTIFQSLATIVEGGVLTSSTVYIDEFASFRTLAP